MKDLIPTTRWNGIRSFSYYKLQYTQSLADYEGKRGGVYRKAIKKE